MLQGSGALDLALPGLGVEGFGLGLTSWLLVGHKRISNPSNPVEFIPIFPTNPAPHIYNVFQNFLLRTSSLGV